MLYSIQDLQQSLVADFGSNAIEVDVDVGDKPDNQETAVNNREHANKPSEIMDHQLKSLVADVGSSPIEVGAQIGDNRELAFNNGVHVNKPPETMDHQPVSSLVADVGSNAIEVIDFVCKELNIAYPKHVCIRCTLHNDPKSTDHGKMHEFLPTLIPKSVSTCSKILVPVQDERNWFLLVVDMIEKKTYMIDPLSRVRNIHHDALKRMMQEVRKCLSSNRQNGPFSTIDKCDSGVFVIRMMDIINLTLRGETFSKHKFSPLDMDVEDWRLKMVVRLIRSKNNSIKDKVIQNAIRGSYHVQL
ncbi:uncharacterized protein [Spinacia oleracea]|uniref:Ubiquitin-like protease family profile domain-containing protein n=1 Tax=Spinacia oleracea TaxID=3562 RepID=A0ABM3RIT0_SPIOL|nr:uncharacterized protein LOC130469967 [Spinacia oleracea]